MNYITRPSYKQSMERVAAAYALHPPVSMSADKEFAPIEIELQEEERKAYEIWRKAWTASRSIPADFDNPIFDMRGTNGHSLMCTCFVLLLPAEFPIEIGDDFEITIHSHWLGTVTVSEIKTVPADKIPPFTLACSIGYPDATIEDVLFSMPRCCEGFSIEKGISIVVFKYFRRNEECILTKNFKKV